VNIRAATREDRELLLELVEEFEATLPSLPYGEDSLEEDWTRLELRLRDGIVLIAEDDSPIGFTSAKLGEGGQTTVTVIDLYVRPEARRKGVAKALLAEVVATAAARGVTHLLLEVDSRNHEAEVVYKRLGFEEESKILRAELPALAASLEPRAVGESFGAVHVQTDDAPRVENAVASYLPRVGRQGGAAVTAAANGWTRVAVDPFDREVQRKLAQELSDRLGAIVVSLAVEDGAVVHFFLYERNRMVDEYLSVPEYYGDLPPGDALALRANPTVVSRLTGADPARVRAIARTADTSAALPPAAELYAQIAELMGLQA
jgi:ribosomal protein S18 acetylase RimI-like enzyme